MNNSNHTFDKNRHRVKYCPCGKSNRDGKFAPIKGCNDKGYCHSCGKTFPASVFERNTPSYHFVKEKKQVEKPIDFLTSEVFLQYLQGNGHLNEFNYFLRWLIRSERGTYAFSIEIVHKLILDYCITNSKIYPGSTLFPYIDIAYRVRDIKLMDYDEYTGKRKREGGKCFYIVSKFIKKENLNTSRCFFGEHLLNRNNKPVKIFESEATAIYAAAFFPDSVCLATGGKHGCKWINESIVEVLRGREVTLYPDLDAYKEWQQITKVLSSFGIKATVSNVLHNAALIFSQKNDLHYNDLVAQKYDLRDVLKYRNITPIDISNKKIIS
ncbi:MAG TPA: DUF6371 domain-containing protein [Bacteroidia bacterium]|jgi:hypothetical protein|nr:DUF6371 domain-containing protein [Bacteroidia bacterium]